jgi:hypothetical protein
VRAADRLLTGCEEVAGSRTTVVVVPGEPLSVRATTAPPPAPPSTAATATAAMVLLVVMRPGWKPYINAR